MNTTRSLQDLVHDARLAGCSMADMARMAGCSRMQLWRLYTGRSSDQSVAGMRLRAALEGDELARIMTAVTDLTKELVANDAGRARKLMRMLQNVTLLATHGKR